MAAGQIAQRRSSMVWHELPLIGNSAHAFEEQIMDLEPFLARIGKPA